MEQCRDEMPFGLSEDESMELSAYKGSLASLTAEPEFYVVVTNAGVWQSFKKCRAEAEFIISRPFNPNYKIVEIFTAPPVPEVRIPADKNYLEPLTQYGLGVDDGYKKCLAEIKRLNGWEE